MEKRKVRRFRKTLRILEHLMNRQCKTCCAEVTLAQCHALLEIEEKTRTTIGKLAKSLNLEKSTVSRTIDDLVNLDLVMRFPHPSDRRYIPVELTEKGKQVCHSINRLNDAYFTKMLENIPGEELDNILSYFEVLVQTFLEFENQRQKNGECCPSPGEKISLKK